MQKRRRPYVNRLLDGTMVKLRFLPGPLLARTPRVLAHHRLFIECTGGENWVQVKLIVNNIAYALEKRRGFRKACAL